VGCFAATHPGGGSEVSAASREEAVAALLEEAAETHHRVSSITDGSDDDWASWYAAWLVQPSELPDVLGTRPVRSHLVHAPVQCDLDHGAATADEPWPNFYARELTRRFSNV
jgi:hypothetical protein